MRGEDATFKHHGIRHRELHALERAARNVNHASAGDANAAAGTRTDGLEVRMDSVEERVGKVEEMVRRLVCCDKQPWIHVPDTIARSLCRMSDCSRQIRTRSGIVDVQSRHTQERRPPHARPSRPSPVLGPTGTVRSPRRYPAVSVP
jgi:hypothetical protein